MSDVHCSVIRQTSVTLPPYTVHIEVDGNRNVIHSSCNCLAGIGSKCKHIGALVVFMNTENSDTKTSEECQWRKPTSAGKTKYSKGKTIEELYPRKKARYSENSNNIPDLELIKNVNSCPLQLMLKAEVTAFCRGIVKNILSDVLQNDDVDSVDSVIQSFPLPIYDDIKLLFSAQEDSKFLNHVLSEPIVFKHNCCKKIYDNLSLYNELDICYESLLDKQKWKNFRQFRITASRCYEIYTYSKIDWQTKSLKYFWPKSFNSKYTNHGLTFENDARQAYSTICRTPVLEVGLVVFAKEPWLAASPDGIIMNNGRPFKLLEIKCPYKGKEVSASEIPNHCTFLKNDNGNIVLKKKHAYFAQVQLGMAMLNVKECDLFIYCSFDKTFKIVNVQFDYDLAMNLVLTLKRNYFQNMLHFICEKNTS